jgi:hypothetical protein
VFMYAYLYFCYVLLYVHRSETMKLNKGKLRKLAQSGEVAALPVSLKRKKVDEGPSK